MSSLALFAIAWASTSATITGRVAIYKGTASTPLHQQHKRNHCHCTTTKKGWLKQQALVPTHIGSSVSRTHLSTCRSLDYLSSIHPGCRCLQLHTHWYLWSMRNNQGWTYECGVLLQYHLIGAKVLCRSDMRLSSVLPADDLWQHLQWHTVDDLWQHLQWHTVDDLWQQLQWHTVDDLWQHLQWHTVDDLWQQLQWHTVDDLWQHLQLHTATLLACGQSTIYYVTVTNKKLELEGCHITTQLGADVGSWWTKR